MKLLDFVLARAHDGEPVEDDRRPADDDDGAVDGGDEATDGARVEWSRRYGAVNSPSISMRPLATIAPIFSAFRVRALRNARRQEAVRGPERRDRKLPRS